MNEPANYPLLRETAISQANKLGQKLSYLEIGVNEGGSAEAVLETASICKAVLIDNWSYGTTMEQVKAKLEPYSSILTILTGDSKELLPTLTEPFDMIFVDGDHEREPALKDMTEALRLLAPNGMMLVDDLDHEKYPFLRNLVLTFAHDHDLSAEIRKVHTTVAILRRNP